LVRRVAVQSKLEQHRRVIIGVAAGLALFFGLVWTISWFENRGLAEDTHKAIAAVGRGSADLNLVNLQALDRLRGQLEDLAKTDSWSFHWGLYTGDNLRDVAGKVYFDRLKLLSLGRINQTLASQMRQDSQADGISTSERLKTHLTITALGCPPDQPLISRVLRSIAWEAHPNLDVEPRMLLNTQLEFYATELGKTKKKLPLELPEDPIAEDKARAYLNSASGGDQQLDSFLTELRGKIKTLVVADHFENYQKVLKGQAEVSGEFTRDGMKAFEEWVENTSFASVGDCGTGKLAGAVSAVANLETRKRVKSRYYGRYAKAWREFLISYNVNRYSTIEDAARRLDILAGSGSPLLGIVKLVAVNTNFTTAKPGDKGAIEKGVERLGFGGLIQSGKKAEKEIEHAQEVRAGDAHPVTKADFARLFQPVLFMTPTEADLLVGDHNGKYVEGLRALQRSLEALSQATTVEKTPLIPQAHQALQQASESRIALADKFENVGNEGLNKTLSDLLEQPIWLAAAVIPQNAGILSVTKKNGDLAQFCLALKPILVKYPFNPKDQSDGATTTDIIKGFAPKEGLVWKYAQQSGAELLVHPEKQEWQPNPNLQGMKVEPALPAFLNRVQQLTNAFFAADGLQPKFRYVLRPVHGQTVVVRLVLDGTEISSESSLQKTFFWPAPVGATPGAQGRVEAGGLSTGFGSFPSVWGVFRLFQNADERGSNVPQVKWSQNRGLGGADPQELNPPAKVEILEFPSGVDLFNPKFFEALKCPPKAVVPN
jgi:type VI secretion system protein ImpL